MVICRICRIWTLHYYFAYYFAYLTYRVAYCCIFIYIFCIFCILQYAEYAEYEPYTIILHIILHIYVRKYASPKTNMQNSARFIFCILAIYMHRPLCWWAAASRSSPGPAHGTVNREPVTRSHGSCKLEPGKSGPGPAARQDSTTARWAQQTCSTLITSVWCNSGQAQSVKFESPLPSNFTRSTRTGAEEY